MFSRKCYRALLASMAVSVILGSGCATKRESISIRSYERTCEQVPGNSPRTVSIPIVQQQVQAIPIVTAQPQMAPPPVPQNLPSLDFLPDDATRAAMYGEQAQDLRSEFALVIQARQLATQAAAAETEAGKNAAAANKEREAEAPHAAESSKFGDDMVFIPNPYASDAEREKAYADFLAALGTRAVAAQQAGIRARRAGAYQGRADSASSAAIKHRNAEAQLFGAQTFDDLSMGIPGVHINEVKRAECKVLRTFFEQKRTADPNDPNLKGIFDADDGIDCSVAAARYHEMTK